MSQQRQRPPADDRGGAGDNGHDVDHTISADLAWRRTARHVLRVLAGTGQPFDSDDVLALVGAPRRGRQLSALFGVARRRKLIQPVGATLNHRGQPVRIWVGAR